MTDTVATYRLRHPVAWKFHNKLTAIKRRYGQEAKDYFLAHPKCERCPENRFACLDVHHPKGKTVKEFEVLCSNCHTVEHASSFTFADVQMEKAVRYKQGRPRRFWHRADVQLQCQSL